MPNVETILGQKGTSVATVDRQATVLHAAKLMNERRIGALVVTSGENAVGIFTERDVLIRIVAAGRKPEDTLVGDVMTSPMACCRRDSDIEECKAVMTSKRIRHLPVVEDGTLYGMISAGDLLANECASQQQTIQYMNEYLYGRR